jgi:predicted MPP superfamily phosphohydrolase
VPHARAAHDTIVSRIAACEFSSEPRRLTDDPGGRLRRRECCVQMTDGGEPIRNLSAWQRLWQRAYGILTPASWPARMAVRLGASLRVSIDRHDIAVPRSLGERDRLRIAFASDFHAGSATPVALLENAIAALAGLDADLLLLGGDFVSYRAECIRELAPLFASIPARLGRYAVLGNHDYWSDAPMVRAQLEAAGVRVLKNEHIRLPEPFADVSLCGLDDHSSGSPDASAAIDEAAPVRIVLMHAPSGLLDIGDRPFTVALCGHTHGGQIALAGTPLVVAHGPLSRRYNAGRYDVGDNRTLLVSRGLGSSAVPFRFNAPPAVTICTIAAMDADEGSG